MCFEIQVPMADFQSSSFFVLKNQKLIGLTPKTRLAGSFNFQDQVFKFSELFCEDVLLAQVGLSTILLIYSSAPSLFDLFLLFRQLILKVVLN